MQNSIAPALLCRRIINNKPNIQVFKRISVYTYIEIYLYDYGVPLSEYVQLQAVFSVTHDPVCSYNKHPLPLADVNIRLKIYY